MPPKALLPEAMLTDNVAAVALPLTTRLPVPDRREQARNRLTATVELEDAAVIGSTIAESHGRASRQPGISSANASVPFLITVAPVRCSRR